MVNRYALLLSLVALQACGPLSVKDAQTGAWVPLQEGTLELHRPVDIPPNRSRIFLQNGEATGRIDEYQPFCYLQLSTLRAETQTVRPDRFTVSPVGERFELVVQRLVTDPYQLAAARSDGGPSMVSDVLYFRLHSSSQPHVSRLACGGAFDDPANAYAPTLQEIAAALGSYASLRP